MTNLNKIPLELRKLDQWVIWKGDKKPRNPRNNQLASVSDPRTWDSFDNACKAAKEAKGVGFVFTENDPYCGVDLDKCIDEDGHMDPEVQAIIDRFGSYTEISQSGRSIHIIGIGKKPTSRCRRGNVEIYDKGRHFALTGDLWQDRGEIKDIQEALDWLCEQTFGEATATECEPMVVSDLVLAPDAEPPKGKLKALIEGNKQFKTAWNHRKKPSPSLSEYDFELACHAIEAGWEDQEIADLLIAFRSKYGSREDFAKALRKDYIPRTIAGARASQAPSDVLKLLTFKVVKMLQYGKDNSRFGLVVDGVGEVDMGITEDLITTKKANARLLEAGLVQSQKVMDRWLDIVRALQPLKEIIDTTTREDDARAWLEDWISRRIPLPLIESKGDIDEIFGAGLNSMAVDGEGRVYLRINDAARFSAVHSGMRGVSPKSIAPDLIKIGFKKKEFRIKFEGRTRQITLWISEPGFVEGCGG